MKKTNRAAALLILLTSALIIIPLGIASAIAKSQDQENTYNENLSETTSTYYDTNRVEFLYATGRYMEAAVGSKRILTTGGEDFPERNQVVLIKWLSDLKLGYTDTSFGFRSATFARLPKLIEVFEILYNRGDFETLVTLSEGVEGPLARYFQGLSLYATGDFDEAEKKILKIPDSFELYPHAELVLSQIMLTRNDADSALSRLGLAGEAAKSKKDYNLKDQINLNIGYILFNTGDFESAELSFARVRRSGKLKDKALSARAWSKIKQGDCKGTLTIIGKLQPLSSFKKDSQELMILQSYCQDILGDRPKALLSLTQAIDLLQALEASYATVYIGGRLPRGIVELLNPLRSSKTIEEDKNAPYKVDYDAVTKSFKETSPASAQALFFLEGLKSASSNDDSTTLALAEDNYKALKILSSLYKKKESEIELMASSLKRKVSAKREGLIFVREHSRTIKEKLRRLSSIIYAKGGSLGGTPTPPSNTKTNIIKRWERHLNRQITAGEEQVIDLVMLDQEDGIWYLNNTQYCQFLYWMAIDPTKANSKSKTSNSELGVIERVVEDLYAAQGGAKTPYEVLLPKLAPLVREKNKEDAERLQTLLLLKKKIRKNRMLAEAATEKVSLEIEEILVRRAGLMRFEIRSVLEKAFILLRDIERKGVQ